MNKHRVLYLVLLSLASAIAGYGRALTPDAFEAHVIDANFAGGYQVSVADIDLDGKPDVIALSTSPSQLVWYKNPSWERHVITTKTKDNIDVAPSDIDHDGDPDLVLAYDFHLDNAAAGGTLAWLECPADPASAGEWAIHPIGEIPTSHRVRWITLAAKGGPAKYLLDLPIIGAGAKAPRYEGSLRFTGFQPPAASAQAAPWPEILIDNTLELAHGIRVVKLDDDASEEVLTASASGIDRFVFEPAANKFTKQHLGDGHAGERPGTGSSEVALGRLPSRHQRFFASIEPWHGNEVAVYEADAGLNTIGKRSVIDNTLIDGHALGCLDVDKDGSDEIVAGGRGGDKALRIYRFVADKAAWESCLVDAGNMGAAGLFVADLNQDGFDDFVAIGTATHNIVWYENKSRR